MDSHDHLVIETATTATNNRVTTNNTGLRSCIAAFGGTA
jgi:hypothetical protein